MEGRNFGRHQDLLCGKPHLILTNLSLSHDTLSHDTLPHNSLPRHSGANLLLACDNLCGLARAAGSTASAPQIYVYLTDAWGYVKCVYTGFDLRDGLIFYWHITCEHLNLVYVIFILTGGLTTTTT
jgi:hypothetical protein